MSRRPPPPLCACGHLHGMHTGGMRCRYRHDPDDDETRCPCPKFTVPGSGAHRPASGRTQLMTPRPPRRRRRWWR